MSVGAIRNLNDTQWYDANEMLNENENEPQVIVINDTQQMVEDEEDDEEFQLRTIPVTRRNAITPNAPVAAPPRNLVLPSPPVTPPGNAVQQLELEDDDDVILIPDVVETIDLCTQPLLPMPNRAAQIPPDQIIEIFDSPTQRRSVAAAAARRPVRFSTRNRERAANIAENAPGPIRNGARIATPTPYPRNLPRTRNFASPSKACTSTTATVQPKSLDDSQDLSQSFSQKVKINCPICFESVVNRNPQSTSCGHIFCKACLVAALALAKRCPMCRKSIGKNGFHNIHLG